MSVARILFALFHAVVAVLLAIGQILLMFGEEPVPLIIHIAMFAFAFCFAATAFYYFRPRAHWDAKLSCPHCQQKGSLRLSALGQPRISILAWFLGGFIGSVLYSHARKRRFHCDSCSEVSVLRTVGGRLAAVWLLFLVFAIAVGIAVRGKD